MYKWQVGGELAYTAFEHFYQTSGSSNQMERVGNFAESFCVGRVFQIGAHVYLQQSLYRQEKDIPVESRAE